MKLKALAIAALLGLSTLPLSGQAAELPNGPHIVTSGKASVDATADIANLAIEVSVSSKDVADAKKQVDDRVAQYFAYLEKQGIERKDISTANLRTHPEYDFPKDGSSELKGYSAVRKVAVTVRQLDKLNALLDGALRAGLTEIRGVELGIANPKAYRDQARQRAIETATSQAKALAIGFNAKLGPIYSIRYQVDSYRPVSTSMIRMTKASDFVAEANVEQTYEQQSIQFDDEVQVVFELRP